MSLRNYQNQVFLSTVFLIATGLSPAYGQANEYGYVFYESTGPNQFILVGRRQVPITFNQTGSDRIALHALMSLKPSILYGNSDGRSITLVGEFQKRTQIFTLRHWYIRTPFVEWAVKDKNHIPHQAYRRLRHSLKREDFQTSEKFNPYDKAFDPLIFTRRSSYRPRITTRCASSLCDQEKIC
jgi:hypothetical protein